MIKRPKRGEQEEDILRMQQEFLAERAKNPKMQPAAQIVKLEKAPKKSLFSKNRQQKKSLITGVAREEVPQSEAADSRQKMIFDDIHTKIVGDIPNTQQSSISNIVLGDIVENSYDSPKPHVEKPENNSPFPRVDSCRLNLSNTKSGRSIFAETITQSQTEAGVKSNFSTEEPMECDMSESNQTNLANFYGSKSFVVQDEATAAEVHKENLEVLAKMAKNEIMEERRQLLNSIDPSLIAFLSKKRQEKHAESISAPSKTTTTGLCEDLLTDLPSSNSAVEILQQSGSEKWVHFDIIEKDKLEWMRDIPMQVAKLNPGEQFEARFDWKGILLPYSTEEASKTKQTDEILQKDERELYLHSSEPHRPGYTLQELFRLARSNVMQQRVSAFGAIAGILNIYNQGFYDKVLELPITKIFFLLRFALDDNTPAMLEIVSKALALLFYNETDETLLDFVFDNAASHWQPTLQTSQNNLDEDDPTSIENLQKQMQQMQMNASPGQGNIKANVDETEEESKTSMSDFQLAETDLIDCFLRTNILQRLYFILNNVRSDNSTVTSCLKLLIRLARTSKEVAMQIINNDRLINCLFDNFLPGFERVDTMKQITPFYNYPQHLCIKLFRVLISQNLSIAVKLVNLNLIEKLQGYIFSSDDIRGKLIKVQIESMRILRCLLLLHVDAYLYKRFLPAFRFMLQWHYNHMSLEVGGSHLVRQHATALLAVISSANVGSVSALEISTTLGELLHNCCCNWFHQARRNDINEFSQITLLSSSLHTMTWFVNYCGILSAADAQRFRNFLDNYLREFLASSIFTKLLESLSVSSSIILRDSYDRRNVHPPLPNVGAVLMHRHGPQLIIPQTYAVHLLNAVWRMLDLVQTSEEFYSLKPLLLDAVIKPPIIEPLVAYLRSIATKINRYLATNFFAKPEMQFIYKLLRFEGIATYFTKAELLQIAYNFVCCLTADQIPEIEQLLQRYIFNKEFLNVEEKCLEKWLSICLEAVYPHYIVMSPGELTLSIPYTQLPVLPRDWPYFQLKIILENYLNNVQQKPTSTAFPEREVLHMTFTFVSQLENCNAKLQIVSPTEKLMYFMIAFMGPDSQFLDAEMHSLIAEQLKTFYASCKDHNFQFEAIYEGKCKFENLYALFVDHFQAASYGDELFSSLVMIPLAQKYNNKWRRRVWSDYASALRFLDCGESWLIGGLEAYLQPPEQDESMIRSYNLALRMNLLRENTLPYKIARYHVDKFKETTNTK